jgi:hypothetical protein
MYVLYSTVQYSTVQYSTVQYSTVQYSTVQYSKYSTNIYTVLFVRNEKSIIQPLQKMTERALYCSFECEKSSYISSTEALKTFHIIQMFKICSTQSEYKLL